MSESTRTPDTKNETLARLLGWEREPRETYRGKEVVRTVMQWRRGRYWLGHTPDYTDWARFPEMQEYVRGLGFRDRERLGWLLGEEMWQRYWDLSEHKERLQASRPLPQEGVPQSILVVEAITPTILRDAIVEVMG